ncbi:hypothetical protein [Bacteroides thetaiotaomicron]|uniref:hypothetical protein n=1 Tax=Bacteroides thetaiotaomicron TaxID=818 RepID=UPI001C232EF9|nr:hypothetical protein [Bacteroides thetaiotaomicron]MBU9076153.1 hypothetical protein [Bacteroides thetaiotaomicron]
MRGAERRLKKREQVRRRVLGGACYSGKGGKFMIIDRPGIGKGGRRKEEGGDKEGERKKGGRKRWRKKERLKMVKAPGQKGGR